MVRDEAILRSQIATSSGGADMITASMTPQELADKWRRFPTRNRALANLYNQRPTWLDLAHNKLDEAVLDAYGWPHDLSDEDILERASRGGRS